ncbi:MAG: calcium-binding protein [Thermoguttaceae bacterium]|jgi:hypothetical protein
MQHDYPNTSNHVPSQQHAFLSEAIAASQQESRIRAALGVRTGTLPKVEIACLRKYYAYLAARLVLPFAAQAAVDPGRIHPLRSEITVVRLVDPDQTVASESSGLLCQSRSGEEQFDLSLVDVEVDEAHPNFQLIEDYWYWFWNWRFDPQI